MSSGMNVTVLIDAIVRQTVVLIARLATSGGQRAPMAHVANQVFLDLVAELKAQGLGQKVIADMFGLALRTYHHRVQRLSESATVRGRSLWEAVLGYIREQELASRAQVLEHFVADDENILRGVLQDLVHSGMVFATGRGDRTSYRAADPQELGQADSEDLRESLECLVWVAIGSRGPLDRAALLELVPMEPEMLEAALQTLRSSERIEAVAGAEPEQFQCEECHLPLGSPRGWEAALFDHYQALVTAICDKLEQGQSRARAGDATGGSTYGFDLWEGHPMAEEVQGFFGRVRDEASDLRQRLDACSAAHSGPRGQELRVIFYAGQTLRGEEL